MTDNKEIYNFEIGDKVRHFKWGIGTVMERIASGEKMKVTVLFQEVGPKKLMVQYANLEKIASAPASAPVKKYKKEEAFAEPVDELAPIVGDADDDEIADIPADLKEIDTEEEVAEDDDRL